MINPVRKSLQFLMNAGYVGLWIATLLMVAAPWIPTSRLPLVQLLPVAAALLLLLHLLAIAYYVRRKWGRRIAAVACLVCGGIAVRQDVHLHWRGYTAEKGLSVLSYNVQTFNYRASRIDSVLQFIEPLHPDVICLQEFRNQRVAGGGRVEKYFANYLGMRHHVFVAHPARVQGLAIFSRYPIVQIDTLFLPEDESNSGFLATIRTPSGDIGIGNIHLTSFSLSRILKQQPDFRSRMTVVSRKAGKVVRRQEQHIDAVLDKLSSYPHPVIMAADMNSVSHTYNLQRLRSELSDSFSKAGNGIGWTYPFGSGYGIRIDYQLVSDDVTPLSHSVLKTDLSDHYPILGRYAIAR